MTTWSPQVGEETPLGYFRVYVDAPKLARKDVTFFRGVPTKVVSYSFADPFSDSTAVIDFPQITVFDDLGVGDLDWLQDFSDLDIVLVDPNGVETLVWEGFITSFEWSSNTETSSLSVQCQGCLFQVDKYLAVPEYPPSSVPYELLITEAFDPLKFPHLRIKPLKVTYPSNWPIKATEPFNPYDTNDYLLYNTGWYVVGIEGVGGNATGYATRNTGAWDKKLTGFVANLLSVMYTTDYADQWTIRKDPGRQPVLSVRRANKTPSHTVNAGAPGVTLNLTRDLTQFANVIYGSGTTAEGSVFSQQMLNPESSRTTYLPMAYDNRVWPANSGAFTTDTMLVETHVQFEDGMNEPDSLRTARLMLRRNSDAGYAGTLDLAIDPVQGSRYLMKAGDVIKIRYLNGTGNAGLNFHIAEVTVSVDSGTVSLKIDTKFRDLLTLDEVLARTRDPLTPTKMLQVGKQSNVIPDRAAPWSYAQGSGCAPLQSRVFFDAAAAADFFPYPKQVKITPPRLNPEFFVAVNASANNRRSKWSPAIPIRMAEKGDIRLTQFVLYDRWGEIAQIPFHVSLYYNMVTVDNMPYDQYGPSPFIPGAFQTTNEFGQPIPAGTPGATLIPDESLIIGWGDYAQPAGYSPGSKRAGTTPTGMLTDETTWSFDCTNNPNFLKAAPYNYVQDPSAITIYAMVYAEYSDWVYVQGRMARKEPGA